PRNTPLPPVSSFAMSATGPDGRGCVLAVGGAIVVLAGDVPLLLDEQAASASAAPTTMLTVSRLVRVRMHPSGSQPDARRHAASRGPENHPSDWREIDLAYRNRPINPAPWGAP